MSRWSAGIFVLMMCWAPPAAAQFDTHQFELGLQLAGTASSEFDAGDFGVGGRLAWSPVSLFGVDAELTFYPSDFADEPAFSRSRLEGLFGVTVGPRIGRLRPFAKLRPGMIVFNESPEPLACILIFPPPLTCTLASGKTLFALDVGGGVELFPTARTFVRIEAGDRLIRYPGPAFDSERDAHTEDFFGHDFRFQIGAGLRF